MNKKTQEEIVGFVLIVLLVAVIAVVFLAINIRKPSEKLPSSEVESFLQASMRQYTDCLISSERRYSLKDAIVSCSETNERCMNGKTSCETAESTFNNLLINGFLPCQDCLTNSYNLKVYGEGNRSILSLKEGNCSGTRTGSFLSLHSYSEKITVELEVCREI